MQQLNDRFFCHQCAKNLIDFRNKSKQEYQKIIHEEKEGCGVFYADQIGDEVEISLNLKKPVLALSFFSSFFFCSTTQAQDTTSTKIEISSTEQPTNISPGSSKQDSSNEVSCDTEAHKSDLTYDKIIQKTNKRRLFINKRFPFIHYGRRRFITVGFW